MWPGMQACRQVRREVGKQADTLAGTGGGWKARMGPGKHAGRQVDRDQASR